MNYNKNCLQFVLEKRILCQHSNSITVLIKNKIRITSRSYLTLKQERGLFLFLGWRSRNLFWYRDILGWWEKLSWKMKNVSYFPNHDALIRTLNMYKNLNMEIHQQINNVKFYYVNIHHWEFDLSRPANLLTLNKEICWTHIFFHLFFLILF